LHPDIRQEGRMANDLTISITETPKEIPICEKLVEQAELSGEVTEQKNASDIMSPSPETAKNISVYQEEVDRLVDDLKEDTCRSRLPITDDQRSQPLVQLPRRDDVRLCRPDNNLVARMPEAPVVTSGENWIAADEDMVVIRPLVQLPGCRRHDKREEFGENTLSLHAEEVFHRECQDAKNICQKDTLSLSPSLLSPLSPPLEEANEKWSCHHFLGLDPAQEASLVVEAWNEMLNSCYNDSISSDKDGLTRPSGHRHEAETGNRCWSEAINGDLKAYERSPDRPPDELNNKDSYRSRIPITDDQCFRPRVRLSWINGHRFSRWDNDNHFSEVPRLLTTTSKALMMDEDIASGPMVRLLGYRQQDERKDSCQRDTGQTLITRPLPPEASEDSDRRDDPIVVTSVPETCREEGNGLLMDSERADVPVSDNAVDPIRIFKQVAEYPDGDRNNFSSPLYCTEKRSSSLRTLESLDKLLFQPLWISLPNILVVLIKLACRFVSWFDTGWQGIETEEFLIGYRYA
jgi:hypothetical protein